MAGGKDATEPVDGGLPVVAVFRIEDPRSVSEMASLAQLIKPCLARGQAVAVLPVYNASNYAWDKTSIGTLTSGIPNNLSTHVQWQSKHIFHVLCVDLPAI